MRSFHRRFKRDRYRMGRTGEWGRACRWAGYRGAQRWKLEVESIGG